jgi:zinc protease
VKFKSLLQLVFFAAPVCSLLMSPRTLAAPQGFKLWEEEKLSNGLNVVYFKESKVPLATIVLVAKAGAFTETKDINGLTHLWEHMFFKGNASLPNQEAFNKKVRELGIVFNGDTSAEIVRYYFTLPSKNLDAGLKFMSDAIATPLLEQKEMERERKVVLDEYDRNASQPYFELNNIERTLLYGPDAHRRNPLGDRPTIEKATKEQLLRIKREVFVPMNCSIIVSGDFERNVASASVKKYFSKWEAPKDWKPVSLGQFKPFTETHEVTMHHKMAQNASLQITYVGPRAFSEPKDTYVADALINLLEHRSGKFYAKYIDSGLTLQSQLGYHTQGYAGELVLYASATAKSLEKVKSSLMAEPKEWLKADYFNDVQLEDVRRKLIVSYQFELNKPSDYTKTLAFWWGTAGLDYLSTYIENVRKVTFADIQQFVKTYFIDKPTVTTVLINEKDALANGIKDNSKRYNK